MKFRHRVEIVGYLILLGVIAFVLWQLAPYLKAWLPTIGNLFGFMIVVTILVVTVSIGSIPFVLHKHFSHKHEVARLEAGKLDVTEKGYMQGFISTNTKERLLVPAIALHSPDVPAHIHIQEDHSNKGGAGVNDWREALAREKLDWEREKFGLLNAPAQQSLPAPRPSVEEIIEKLSSDELEFSTGTSLTTRELIKIGLAGRHIKIIGGSQMGKSSLTGAILEQIRRKYSPAQVRLAILDLEDMTGTLFEDAPHILEMRVNGEMRKVHARNSQEVAIMLTWLAEVMRYRYGLIQQKGLAYVERLPRILCYFEEFLDWKKTLIQRVPDESLRNDAIAAINTISTRGLKVGMHLLICAQVDYADQSLQSAMAQFVGINVAFCVKPKAAQAAGFTDNERLNENYAAKTPGRYVIEMIGGGDMGVSPEFDVKSKIKAIQLARFGGDDVIDGEVEEMPPLDVNGTPGTPQAERYEIKYYDRSDADQAGDFEPKTNPPASVRTFPRIATEQLAEQPDATSEDRPKEYRFTDMEISQFLAAYRASRNVDKAIMALRKSAPRYRKHANEILAAYNARQA